MIPLPIPGIALAGSMLLSRYNQDSTPGKKNKRQFKLPSQREATPQKSYKAVNPFENIFRGLSSTLSQLIKGSPREDYAAVVQGFIPAGARLLKPQYPLGAGEIQLADVDGDSRNELIASFRHHDELRTVILKKQSGVWGKSYEINNANYEAVHYRGLADITGEGKNQLLLGLFREGSSPYLYGYSIADGNTQQIFSHNYNKFDLLNLPGGRGNTVRPQLGIWNRNNTGAYDIEVFNWDGSGLRPVSDTFDYYYRSVVPHWVQRARQEPSSPAVWYNLADALVKAGVYRDASVAIEVGLNQDRNSEYREKFIELKKSVIK